jgi:hypothetical protein
VAKKKYYHIDLPPDVQAFKDRLVKATSWEKTTCNLTFYKMYGLHYIRSKSSLTGKRVKRSKQFASTMHNAGVLARASKIVTPLYYEITEDWRCQDVFRKLTGIAVKLLHEGKNNAEVEEGVQAALTDMGYRTEWSIAELPPNLQQWLEEDTAGIRKRKMAQVLMPSNWTVNENGELIMPSVTIQLMCSNQEAHSPP